ncbi:MAG: bifunctional 3-phenylpropionate/cinnamic acid dioxygenase ferredoxin subunit [Parvularculaceae bacterium]
MTWTTVAKFDELPEEEGVCVVAEGRKIALFKIGDEVFAIDDTCSHAEAQLSQGFVEDCAVECPLHQACFDLRTGAALSAPATEPVNTYPAKVEAGAVLIEL